MGSEIVQPEDSIYLNAIQLKQPITFRYYRFYKPVGVESSLHPKVENGIRCFDGEKPGLAIAGRLDKASEGLLLISDDGKWIEGICNPKEHKLKTYEVVLMPQPNQKFVEDFSNGIVLGDGYQTRPCQCRLLSAEKVEIQLTEGKNRQIRRMCHKLGYTVLQLKRIAISDWKLEGLSPMQYADFEISK